MWSIFLQISLALAAWSVALSTPLARAELCGPMFAPSARTIAAPKPHLILFSAPSGGGKTTLAQLLLKEYPRLKVSVSTTTRAPRGAEKDGVDYHFTTVDAFKKKIAEGKFAEWAEVHGNFYGTETAAIEEAFAQGYSVLALVDVQGAQVLRQNFKGDLFTIFISPPDMATLEARLRGRGTDPEAAIQKRLANARQEMDRAKEFDRVVVNGDLQQALLELRTLIEAMGLIPR